MLAHCVPESGKICSNPATYNVWFDGCGGLYGFMCNEHVAKAIVEGVNGYRVYQITALKEDSQYPIPAPNNSFTRPPEAVDSDESFESGGANAGRSAALKGKI